MLEQIALNLVDPWMDAWCINLSGDERRDLIEKIADYFYD